MSEKIFVGHQLINPKHVEFSFISMFSVNCSSRSRLMSRVSRVPMSIPQKTACGTVGRRKKSRRRRRRRRTKRRKWQLSSPAWWDASIFLDRTSSPARLCPTAKVRQQTANVWNFRTIFFFFFFFGSALSRMEKKCCSSLINQYDCPICFKLSDTTVCTTRDPYWTNGELHIE